MTSFLIFGATLVGYMGLVSLIALVLWVVAGDERGEW